MSHKYTKAFSLKVFSTPDTNVSSILFREDWFKLDWKERFKTDNDLYGKCCLKKNRKEKKIGKFAKVPLNVLWRLSFFHSMWFFSSCMSSGEIFFLLHSNSLTLMNWLFATCRFTALNFSQTLTVLWQCTESVQKKMQCTECRVTYA